MPNLSISTKTKTLSLIALLLLSACHQHRQFSDRNSLLELHNLARLQGYNCPYRLNKKADSLNWNNSLANVAHAHSVDMHTNQKLSHNNSSRLKLGERLNQAGYEWRTYAENIAFGVYTDKEAFDLWIQSGGHCKNIMNGAYTEMGSANVNGYWTAIYARQK